MGLFGFPPGAVHDFETISERASETRRSPFAPNAPRSSAKNPDKIRRFAASAGALAFA